MISKWSQESSNQFRMDVKIVKSRYQNLGDLVNERISNLEKLISELKLFQDDYMRTANSLKRAESNLQLEHGSNLSATIQEQLINLKQTKNDLEILSLDVNRLNEHAQKYLSFSNSADFKFISKLKNDLNDLNEKFTKLRNTCLNRQYNLEVKKTKHFIQS